MAVLCVLVPAAVWAALAAIDPYDSGRLGSLLGPGVPPQGPRTAHAGRVRDPAFDAAVIGNSHVQLLSPERLSGLTGLRFVSLTVPGAGVAEQEAILRRFAAEHGAGTRAVVVGIDGYTCHSGRGLLRTDPFPFWLYAPDRLAYAAGLFRLDAAEAAVRRVAALAGRGARARRDGWWDYEEGRAMTPALAEALGRQRAQPLADGPGPFPGVEALAVALGALPEGAAAVLLVPPVYGAAEPQEQAHARACLQRLAAVAASRPMTALVDARTESPVSGDRGAFWDAGHYTRPVAESLERVIASRLAGNGAKTR